ncbi:MAG: hypothetical protein AAF617_05645 [Bacteroidota bacterium]
MKKKNLNKLTLKKTAISKLDNVFGGAVAKAANANAAAGTNVWSNCEVCESLRVTQCKDKCPNFTKAACGNAVPVNAAAANNAAAAV